MKFVNLDNLGIFYTKLKTVFASKVHTHATGDITQSATARFVTDTEKATWSAKSNFSGSYADLTNKPTLFTGDYNALTNKPTIPTMPTKTSQLTNDSGFLTSATLDIQALTETEINGLFTV